MRKGGRNPGANQRQLYRVSLAIRVLEDRFFFFFEHSKRKRQGERIRKRERKKRDGGLRYKYGIDRTQKNNNKKHETVK